MMKIEILLIDITYTTSLLLYSRPKLHRCVVQQKVLLVSFFLFSVFFYCIIMMVFHPFWHIRWQKYQCSLIEALIKYPCYNILPQNYLGVLQQIVLLVSLFLSSVKTNKFLDQTTTRTAKCWLMDCIWFYMV